MSHEISVRVLEPGDERAWRALWDGYNAFYRHELPEDVTRSTFARLCEQRDGLFGLVATGAEGELVGFAHALLHPSTWTTATYCYLEDLFVGPEARGAGTGRALVEAVYAQADARGAVRVYWQTEETNVAARALYDRLARRTEFVVYRR